MWRLENGVFRRAHRIVVPLNVEQIVLQVRLGVTISTNFVLAFVLCAVCVDHFTIWRRSSIGRAWGITHGNQFDLSGYILTVERRTFTANKKFTSTVQLFCAKLQNEEAHSSALPKRIDCAGGCVGGW